MRLPGCLCCIVASLLASTAITQQTPSSMAAILAEYDASIAFLKESLKKNWNEDQFLQQRAIENKRAKVKVEACMEPLDFALQQDHIWNEQLPFPVQVQQALDTCANRRALLIANAKEKR